MAEKIVKDSQGLAKELVNGVKEFEELKVIDLNGRPYYSIIYLENGNEFEGYASYNLKVISEYLKRHFGFAQPETHDKRTESHACDLISRQAVIDALRTHERKPSKKWLDNQLDIEWNNAIDICCYDIEDLPSAQPEQTKMIKEIRKWINSKNRGSADYFIVDKIEEIINKYEE